MKFNLATHLGIIKEAMGAPSFINTPPLECWDYEKIADAPDDSTDPDVLRWKEYLQVEPSVESILRIAQGYQIKYLKDIKKVYGMDAEQAKHIFKIWIAYEPSRGGYILFAGPYFSKGLWHGSEHIRDTALDKFTYSTMKYRQASPQEINSAMNKAVGKINKLFSETQNGQPTGINFDVTDFSLVDAVPEKKLVDGGTLPREKLLEIKNPIITPYLDNKTNDPEIQAENERIHAENMANNPEATQMYDSKHLFATVGSKLNGKGYLKVMQGLLGPWYNEAIAEKRATLMQEQEINEEEAQAQLEEGLLQDDSGLQALYGRVRKRWMIAKKAQDPRVNNMIAEGYPEPPSPSSNIFYDKSGQLAPREVPNNVGQVVVLKLRKKIIDLVKNGITDVDEIVKAVNETQFTGKDITSDKVAAELNKIAKIRRDLQAEGAEGTYDEITAYIDNILAEVDRLDAINKEKKAKGGTGSHGFKDFNTAFEMLAALVATPPTLKLEDQSNLQSQDLHALREMHMEEEEKILEGDPLAPEELAEDLGEGLPQQEKEEFEIEEIEAAPPAPAPGVPLAPAPGVPPAPVETQVPATRQRRKKAPMPQPMPPVEEDQEENLLDLINYTVKNLIKIARELDKEGKGEAAEEVHQVIRKYQKRVI